MKIQYVYPTRRGIIVSFVLLLMAAGGADLWAWRADRSLPVRQLSVSNQAEKHRFYNRRKTFPALSVFLLLTKRLYLQ
jgi:hypothetical protein